VISSTLLIFLKLDNNLEMLEKLVTCLPNRFEDTNEKVLHSVRVASFFQWPADLSTEEGIRPSKQQTILSFLGNVVHKSLM